MNALPALAWIVDGNWDPNEHLVELNAMAEAGLKWIRLREANEALAEQRLISWQTLWPGLLSVHSFNLAQKYKLPLHAPASYPLSNLKDPIEPLGRSIHGKDLHTNGECSKRSVTKPDYYTLGNIYETTTHPGRVGLGVKILESYVHQFDRPIRAIGGITLESIRELKQHGASGIDVMSCVSKADDKAAVVNAVLELWDRA